MKKTTLKITLLFLIILSFFIIGLEPSIGRYTETLYELSYESESNIGYVSNEDDIFNDIIVTNSLGAGISVLLGNGSGGFSLFKSYSLGGEYPQDIVTDVFNNDELLDLAIPHRISNYNVKFAVFLGEGHGLFGGLKQYSISKTHDGITSGDFNNDANIDVAVLGHFNCDSTLDVFLGSGNGSFGSKWSLELPKGLAYRLASGYLNNDNFLDLGIVSHCLDEDYLTILFGNGTGHFYVDQAYQNGDGYHSVEITIDDFNQDDIPDIATTNYFDDDVSLFYNDGNGKFTERKDFNAGFAPKCLISEDFNMDDYPDLAVTIRAKVSILINDGNGGFENPVEYNVGSSPQGNELITSDFDGDNFLDLVITNYGDDTVTFLRGYGNGTFGARQDYYAGETPYGIVAGNFNPILIPDLNCGGSLSWTNVTPDSTVTGYFYVENIGFPASSLDWEIESKPGWGTWTITPEEGYNLTPELEPFVVEVSVKAPDEKNKEFTGKVKIVNMENSSDFCTIDVSLVTPKNKPFNFYFDLFGRLLHRFPLLQKILDVVRLNFN